MNSRFQPVALPRDGRALARFPDDVAAEIGRITREAVSAGRWESTQDLPISLRDNEFLAYWIHKSGQPVPRAKQGSGVEAALEAFRRRHFELLPDGFAADAEVSMSAVGDLIATQGLEHARDGLYAEVAGLIFGADIAYANLEATLTEGQIVPFALGSDDTPSLNLTVPQYEALVSHAGRRYDVLQLANNHILDCGEEGLRTTLRRLAMDRIEPVGVNHSAAAAACPRITQLAGLRIGWVAHTFGLNFKPLPEGQPWAVNVTPFHMEQEPDVSAIETQVRACRREGCDLVFVALHWGLEFECFPHPDQLRWAHRFADAGADLVIGHHPHVVQPVEIYCTGDNPTRAVPILYSLGNLTPVFSHPAAVLSLVARLRLVRGSDRHGCRALVAALDLTPVALLQSDGLPRLCTLASLDEGADLDPGYLDELRSHATRVLGADWRAAG